MAYQGTYFHGGLEIFLTYNLTKSSVSYRRILAQGLEQEMNFRKGTGGAIPSSMSYKVSFCLCAAFDHLNTHLSSPCRHCLCFSKTKMILSYDLTHNLTTLRPPLTAMHTRPGEKKESLKSIQKSGLFFNFPVNGKSIF